MCCIKSDENILNFKYVWLCNLVLFLQADLNSTSLKKNELNVLLKNALQSIQLKTKQSILQKTGIDAFEMMTWFCSGTIKALLWYYI